MKIHRTPIIAEEFRSQNKKVCCSTANS